MIGGLKKSTSSLALFAAAGLFVGGVAMPSAKAADLGGDCCADLEERVAELEATTARKGNRRVSLTVSGQVSTQIMAWDDGSSVKGQDSSGIFIVDNGNNRSGFQFDGSARINPNLTAGFQLVIGLALGARSHQTNQTDDDGGAIGDGTVGVELANWYLTHSQLGSIRVGRINTAGAGTTNVDLGGAGVIASAGGIGLWQAGMFMVNAPTGLLSATKWQTMMGGTTVGVSSLSRHNAISYTTPTLGGFSASAAWGEADAVDDAMWDVALRYAGEFSGFRVAAAVSYAKNQGGLTDASDQVSATPPAFGDGADLRQWKGSASGLHVASGLYLTGAYLNQSYNGTSADELIFGTTTNRPDTTMWYLQGGIAKNWTGMGNTVVYGEYANIEDGAAGLKVNAEVLKSSEVTMWGVGIVQHIDAAAMEVYLAYRQYGAEATEIPSKTATGQTFEDFSVVMAGARVRF